MELIDRAPWREAVTYRETWPHEYVVINRDGQQELLAAFCERISLAGVDRTGLERVLIEAKFWAGLTGNQPTAYLERLPTNTPSALLFVAPAARLETLWDELCQRAGVNGPLAETSEEFRSVTMAGARHLMLTSWTHLLERLDGAGDEHTMIAVQQLRGLTKSTCLPDLKTTDEAYDSELVDPPFIVELICR